MKLAENTVEKTGNLVFEEEEAMDFDPAARGILLNNFIQQYGEPYSAALREYTSNALDEHILLGLDRPIEVSLPTALSPNLVIRDWGRGMDRAALKEYSRFGFSSKRDSDEQRGGFGLGSKSGLAIASQFTVSSVKDGVRNILIIGRDQHGSPQSGYLPATETDAPNGTTITIPTSENYRFRTAIEEGMFLGWKPGTILINGKEPEQSLYNEKFFRKLGDFGWQSTDYIGDVGGYYNGQVDLAGVKMVVDWDKAGIKDTQLRRGYLARIVLKLDNSSVELLRSREGFIYDARTRAAIQARVEDVVSIARAEFQKEIDGAADFRSAIKVALRAKSYGFGGDYLYKGEKLSYDDYTGNKSRITTAFGNYSEKVDRSPTEMSYVTQSAIGQTISYADTILIYGASVPERKTVNAYELHPEAYMAHWYLRFVADRDQKSMRETRLYYTHMTLAEVKAARLDKLFPTVLSATEVSNDVAAFRKAAMAETRKINKAAKVTPTVAKAKVLEFTSYGNSYVEEVEVGKLDLTQTYVLLKNDESTFGDRVKRALTTRVGDADDPKLSSFVKQLVAAGKFKILIANKSDDTSSYGKVLTMKGIAEAIQEEIDSLQTGFSDTQLMALRDLRGTQAHWARRLHKNSVAAITNDETREWALALRDDKMQERFSAANSAVSLAETYPSALKAPKQVVATSTTPSPTERYPMLAYTGYYNTPDSAVLEYIKLIDG